MMKGAPIAARRRRPRGLATPMRKLCLIGGRNVSWRTRFGITGAVQVFKKGRQRRATMEEVRERCRRTCW
ncbi:MAG: hypothetical protein HS102_06870 [Planctomycetia bacterium]|nr:MAG: hypothetical protein EDS66_05145 [Planctomycetota bacterium]MBE7456332.1 hypothetical protein [Planctomycetia bacterium]MCK6465662.1 hypothetical protein [Phycisphaerae bacterium]MCQ3921152.1 hypothetical protein [Planctomycetota bacterium]